jgi:hypothetical protein
MTGNFFMIELSVLEINQIEVRAIVPMAVLLKLRHGRAGFAHQSSNRSAHFEVLAAVSAMPPHPIRFTAWGAWGETSVNSTTAV